MSEKKEKITTEAAKKEKNNAPAKKKAIDFKAVGAKVKKFFKDFKGEWKKVTWPSKKTVLNHSLVVIVVVAVVGEKASICLFLTLLGALLLGLEKCTFRSYTVSD